MRVPQTARRVVITGLGAVTPLGHDVPTTWANLLAGRCAIGPVTRFDAAGLPSQLAAEVRDFDPTPYMRRKDARRVGPVIQFAYAAARQAVEQAGLDVAALTAEQRTRIGVEVSSALGGATTIAEQSLVLAERGPRRVNPTLIPATLTNMLACYIAVEMNLHGPVSGPVLACATGLAAIGEAARRIVYGQADVMLAGAADSILTPLAFVGFGRIGALSSRNETPQRAVTPFDATRDGTVIGEGGAVVLLESLAHAEARGATILAEVLGYGLSADGYHLAAPEPSGRGAAHAMRLALADADLAPADIDYIAAHGTGTVLNDVAETQAVKAVFGSNAPPPLSSLKGMTGHLMGASGSLACVATVNAIQAGQVPPTIGWQVPDPACDLDYIPHQARPLSVQRAMVNAFGFGGQNASLVIAKH